MYDTGYGGKSIGYGRDRISDFPMRKPSGKGMRIPISNDIGFGVAMIFMTVVGILAIAVFWTQPIFWVIVFVGFCTWIAEKDESENVVILLAQVLLGSLWYLFTLLLFLSVPYLIFMMLFF